MLTREQIDELKQAISRVYFIAFSKISDPDARKVMVQDGENMQVAIDMAETLLRVGEWTNSPSGIINHATAGGYSNAQFDVQNIIDRESVT